MPAVCRGDGVDFDIPHCSPMNRLGLSPNVRVNSIGISRQGDFNTPHLKTAVPLCAPHTAPIFIGSTTVKVNGRGCGRIGDILHNIFEPGAFFPNCTLVATGSLNVFAGG